MTALKVADSTEFAPEVSPAASASPSVTETVATVGSEMSTAVHLPAVLPQGEKQAPHRHSPTSAPPAPWKKSLAPHTEPHRDFSSDNSPMAREMAANEEPTVTGEQQTAVSPSQKSSVTEASPDASQQVAALTNTPTDTAVQEQRSSPLPALSNQTASSTTRSHAAFGGPQVRSEGGPSTAPPVTGDAGASTLNATLDTHTETGGENSSWSEKYTATMGSPALPGFSSASSSTPSSAVDRSEYESSRACMHGNATMWETKRHSESKKIHSCPQWSGLKVSEISLSVPKVFSCRNWHFFSKLVCQNNFTFCSFDS